MTTNDDPVLHLLGRNFAHQWSIRRTENLWIATAVDHDTNHAPTIVQPDLETFVRELVDPPQRAARPARSILDAALFQDRLTRIGDGVYVEDRPPTL